jgi:LuxR family transcriptional regulator, quorum-sensing system regulator BjaR1
MSGTITNEDVSGAFETIEALGRLSSPQAIINRLAEYLSRYGFTAFVVSGLPPQAEQVEPSILLNGWPKDWYIRYMQANHYRHDPCVRTCFNTIEPFVWSELPPSVVNQPKSKLVMSDAAEFGLKDGLCVPLHDVHGFQGVVTMAGDRIEVPPSARKMVHLTSLYAYGAAERAVRPVTVSAWPRLTDREREILRWIAAGKTGWEIGEILGIAEATVSAHMANVRQKLGTRNAAHSVAEALRRHEFRL